uniref:DNA repair protein UVH3 n=1 Tax=Erigeron canadensis TaxID=72917 RepID=UPI001CB92318|nr:DNA repair protein UVH3 [Erigeron canadensis]
MGVHGLWDLLSPVGRRVSVETLAGKRLAIDASIWMIQFMKAMRDERGEMVRNAHILGFFRRICKLLFLRTKPVFVFDGATPALKRRTVIARRRQRENAQTKIRKTAEKLLLNHLKAMRLKELADDLENQRKSNDGSNKGKRVVTDEASVKMDLPDTKGVDQEALDAMLAASIEAEENEGFVGEASTSGVRELEEDEDGDDDDEEMLLPALQGKVDPAVLASLPPSMQLDLLGQMRERLMAENRQKYQKVKKAPARFSELQIESYLKTVAFRREINEVQKVAAGRGVNGMQTSRIASESNREYIFSSSFTGNKQSLASSGLETNSNVQSQIPTKRPSTSSVNGETTNKSSSVIESVINNPKKAFHEDVETYRDEWGRIRVNKMKAMGIRMTRDLQRNLDLMKEIEQDKVEPSNKSDDQISQSKETAFPSKLPETSKDTNQESVPVSGITIELSLEAENELHFVDSDDDVFAQIVAIDPLVASSADNVSSVKQSTITLSDCEWEEGMPADNKEGSLVGQSTSDASEVEWEEGPSDNPELGSVHEVETVSRGDLLEEADFQEAIRRSIDDMTCQNDIDASFAPEAYKDDKNIDIEASFTPIISSESELPSKLSINVDETNINTANCSSTQLEAATLNGLNLMKVQMETSYQCHIEHEHNSIETANDDWNSQGETGLIDKVNPENGVGLSKELHDDSSIGDAETLISSNSIFCTAIHISNSSDVGVPVVALNDSHKHEVKAPVISNSLDTTFDDFQRNGTAVKESKSEFDSVQKVTEEKANDDLNKESEDRPNKFVLTDMSEEQVEITKASLEEELASLTKERSDLGDEQRRHERNAESVSGDMFAECQELLQMFGLPYIIAPMEAEAQCAFMELENLVDGVVTDDSDVLLFGARSVYKNIFDDRKYVETYFMKDIESELGLTREKLIRMAMLLGSDYTEGISGIGIVNAVEVLNAFPEVDGLHKFREWIESPDPSILGKVDAREGSSTRKRGSNSSVEETSLSVSRSDDDDAHKMKQIFMDKHRNVSKNWHIPSTFPSDVVISAYASPQVDKSTEPFSWGKPDLFVLRKLCSEKFGWGTQKADELLQPVLKEYNKHETQLRLEAFYTFNERFAKIRSKRISKAVRGIAGSKTTELVDDSEQDPSNGKKRKKVKTEQSKDDSTPTEKSEPSFQEGQRKNTKKGSSVRGRGRGRGQSSGKGRSKKKHTHEHSGSSSDDRNSSDYVQEVHAGHSHGVRKSKRVRKSLISMTIEDSEIDEPTTLEDHADAAGDEEDTLVSTAALDVDGSNDHEIPLSGSGTHVDEVQLGQNSCQNDVDGPEEELSREYLHMGGGFCLDEDEGDKEPGLSNCSSQAEGLKESAAHEVDAEASDSAYGAVDSAAAGLQRNNEQDDDGIRPVTYLSAMPNLRKKRKKV